MGSVNTGPLANPGGPVQVVQVRRLASRDSRSTKICSSASAIPPPAVDLARAIETYSLKIFLGVNPTFFAVNADLDPDIVADAQMDSTL